MAAASTLQGCVKSLETSRHLLDSSIAVLDTGVQDFPRLSKVLQTTRHFELISEPDLKTAQAALHSEIKPEVDTLLNRVSNYLDKLERREQSLIAKYDLNEGRISRDNNSNSNGRSAFDETPPAKPTKAAGSTGAKLNALEELKYRQLRQKKERLSYAVDRLTMQAQQRERQLRMSMAAPHQWE